MLKKFLLQVVSGRNLSKAEADEAMTVIMSGQATEAQIGAFLTALRLKEETSEEIAGFAAGMRRQAEGIQCTLPDMIDTCGTGGDGTGTFNVSTTAAFVLAGGGVPVAKHGNRGISSSCGSADVLTELGIAVDMAPKRTEEAIHSLQIGFLYAPVFHKAMKYAAGPRRELGFRTVFNLLGPLTNPAKVERQMIGVYDKKLTEKVAQALLDLGTKQAMVVHSFDGMDEISTSAPTCIAEVKAGQVISYTLHPEEYGFYGQGLESYKGGTAKDNAQIVRRVLQGEAGPHRDIVLLNSAAGFVVAGKAETVKEGLVLAAYSIDSGAAFTKLEELAAFSRSAKAAARAVGQ
ncbi:MAG: anthranilate phosphoribosyltransferase [Sporomusaceae bacterium]|nr:anthranilate phosphoribosyltransferase [Sporomusaceae bacterium]